MDYTKNTLSLPNVHGMEGAEKDSTIEVYSVHPTIAEVIWELASKNPLWQFHAKYGTRGYKREHYTYSQYDVKLDGKLLGSICRVTTRHGESAIDVRCKRIHDKMQRKGSYTTTDAKKAIAKVKKEFAPKTRSEIIIEAMEEAANVAASVFHTSGADVTRLTGRLNVNVLDFFREGPGAQMYTEYLRNTNDTEALGLMYKLDESKSEMMTIDSVRQKLGTTDTALVVVDEGKYLVKIATDVQSYSDNTLPENMRGKLGLLKLVEPNQFVSSAGFRVSDEVFVVDLAQA